MLTLFSTAFSRWGRLRLNSHAHSQTSNLQSITEPSPVLQTVLILALRDFILLGTRFHHLKSVARVLTSSVSVVSLSQCVSYHMKFHASKETLGHVRLVLTCLFPAEDNPTAYIYGLLASEQPTGETSLGRTPIRQLLVLRTSSVRYVKASNFMRAAQGLMIRRFAFPIPTNESYSLLKTITNL